MHVRIFRSIDGIFFGMRGSLTSGLTAGNVYTINVPNMLGGTSGNFITHSGYGGYIQTTGSTIELTPSKDISGWILASGVLIYGL